jgi:phospholipid-binding lipoprotein MlaA
MRYVCKAQKGFSVFISAFIVSFLYAPTSFADTTTSTDAADVPAQAVSKMDVAKSDVKTDAKTDTVTDTKSDGPAAEPVAAVADPYEGYNRVVFKFNDKIDTYFLKPVATFYNTIMPKPLNLGIHNFFNNINNIPTAINDLLQFNFYQMANDLWRLGINTTVGIGGLFDVASRMNLEQYDNDFGLTLAKWGYRNSNYFVVPFWGPKTIRDVAGMPVDYFAFSVYPYIQPTSTQYGVYGLGVVDFRAQRLKVENVMDEASLDKYVFVRNAYMQNRAYKINQNDHRTFADVDKGKPVPNDESTD